MQTRTAVIIGFTILFVIFGVSSFLQWQCAQDIKKVSEYHRNMSIPAMSILDQTKLSFQEMHIASIETVESDLIIEHEEEYHSYQNGKDLFLDNLEKYNFLIFAKNSRGEFVAGKMMQEQMHGYIQVYREIINSNDAVMAQFEKGEISSSSAIVRLASIEINFHETIEENSAMEIKGMEKNQDKIIEIGKQMEQIFVSSAVTAIISTIMIIIFISRFVSTPISKLVEITKIISKGEKITLDINSKNSDVNNVLIALNQMSKDLEVYKSKIIMQEKLSSIGELASRLAHDIKNPLTVIKVTLDMMKTNNKDLTPDEIEKFERVDTAMYRITHQIDNVLDFIKGKPLKFQKYEIKKILDSVIADLPKSNKIIIEIVSEDSEIECDFEAMKVILINLIINAIQAIKDNEGIIKIKSKVRGDKVVIEIEDNGPGIPEEILEKIFEPLYTTKEEGTGLGLVSCKSLVDQHHGKISVKNNPTRFIIEIPKNIQQKTE